MAFGIMGVKTPKLSPLFRGLCTCHRNPNGRSDGIPELFGHRSGGGFVKMAKSDRNGERPITGAVPDNEARLVWEAA